MTLRQRTASVWRAWRVSPLRRAKADQRWRILGPDPKNGSQRFGDRGWYRHLGSASTWKSAHRQTGKQNETQKCERYTAPIFHIASLENMWITMFLHVKFFRQQSWTRRNSENTIYPHIKSLISQNCKFFSQNKPEYKTVKWYPNYHHYWDSDIRFDNMNQNRQNLSRLWQIKKITGHSTADNMHRTSQLERIWIWLNRLGFPW